MFRPADDRGVPTGSPILFQGGDDLAASLKKAVVKSVRRIPQGRSHSCLVRVAGRNLVLSARGAIQCQAERRFGEDMKMESAFQTGVSLNMTSVTKVRTSLVAVQSVTSDLNANVAALESRLCRLMEHLTGQPHGYGKPDDVSEKVGLFESIHRDQVATLRALAMCADMVDALMSDVGLGAPVPMPSQSQNAAQHTYRGNP